MDMQKLGEFVAWRRNMEETGQEDLPNALDSYFDEFSDLLAKDVQDTVKFILESPNCTDDVFSWMSEVFDDVARKTQSWKFVDALKVAAKRFPEACRKYNIAGCIQLAEEELL